MVSRVVLEQVMGKKLGRRVCAVPSCGNKSCVSEKCLKAVPRGKVLERVYATGARCIFKERKMRREGAKAQGWAKLDEGKAAEIRGLKGIELARDIAKRYGVGVDTIYRIWQGKHWPDADRVPHSSVFTYRPAA